MKKLNCGHHWGHRKDSESLDCRKCAYEPYYDYPPHEMHKAGVIGEKATPEQMIIFNNFINSKEQYDKTLEPN